MARWRSFGMHLEPGVVKEDDQLNFLDCCIIPV